MNIPANVRIDYNYFVATGNGYIDERSYTTSSDSINYEEIPQHTTNGDIISLRDSYDYRPFRLVKRTHFTRQAAVDAYGTLGMFMVEVEMRLIYQSILRLAVALKSYFTV